MWLSRLKKRSYQLILTKQEENRKIIVKYPLKNSSKSVAGAAASPGEQFNVPDQVTGRAGQKELQAANPSWMWNCVEINVSLEELQRLRTQVATGLEKVSFHSNPKKRQCERMLIVPHNCTHLSSAQFSSVAQS